MHWIPNPPQSDKVSPHCSRWYLDYAATEHTGRGTIGWNSQCQGLVAQACGSRSSVERWVGAAITSTSIDFLTYPLFTLVFFSLGNGRLFSNYHSSHVGSTDSCAELFLLFVLTSLDWGICSAFRVSTSERLTCILISTPARCQYSF